MINAVTDFDKKSGVGEGYTYDHNSKGAFIKKDNFPQKINNRTFLKLLWLAS